MGRITANSTVGLLRLLAPSSGLDGPRISERPRTLPMMTAMAAGVSDHAWRLEEIATLTS